MVSWQGIRIRCVLCSYRSAEQMVTKNQEKSVFRCRRTEMLRMIVDQLDCRCGSLIDLIKIARRFTGKQKLHTDRQRQIDEGIDWLLLLSTAHPVHVHQDARRQSLLFLLLVINLFSIQDMQGAELLWIETRTVFPCYWIQTASSENALQQLLLSSWLNTHYYFILYTSFHTPTAWTRIRIKETQLENRTPGISCLTLVYLSVCLWLTYYFRWLSFPTFLSIFISCTLFGQIDKVREGVRHTIHCQSLQWQSDWSSKDNRQTRDKTNRHLIFLGWFQGRDNSMDQSKEPGCKKEQSVRPKTLMPKKQVSQAAGCTLCVFWVIWVEKTTSIVFMHVNLIWFNVQTHCLLVYLMKKRDSMNACTGKNWSHYLLVTCCLICETIEAFDDFLAPLVSDPVASFVFGPQNFFPLSFKKRLLTLPAKTAHIRYTPLTDKGLDSPSKKGLLLLMHCMRYWRVSVCLLLFLRVTDCDS